MTVAALWSILAGSGTLVGLQDFISSDDCNGRNRGDFETRPSGGEREGSNGQQPQPQPPKKLAVDLSIWICEALASSVLCNFHAAPAVHLVNQRTVYLLKLGIQLIVVVEGNRRRHVITNGGSGTDNANNNVSSRRHGGSTFARACRSCEQLLEFLGVPVVRATHEGEALCALLNLRGVVDGVISNDGDVLLFGARTIYTNFSVQNLERGLVTKYDASNLRAIVEETNESISLGRDDLIAFALLTGSDLVGEGVPHVGPKKAIRFIQACRRSRDGFRGRPAIEVLMLCSSEACANATAAAAASTGSSPGRTEPPTKGKERCCSLCLHPGDKRNHEKHGCSECGTDPGEECFAVSHEERYKLAIRAKVLSKTQLFVTQPIIDAYRSPNMNVIPQTIKNVTLSASSRLPMEMPRYHDMLNSTTLVKGNTMASSQDHLRQTLPRLLARLFILAKAESNVPENRYKQSASRPSDTLPVPIRIIRRSTHEGHACYEISWKLGGELEFVTHEWKTIIDSKLSMLVDQFHRDERATLQAQNELNRRAMFGGGGNQAATRKQGGGGVNNHAGAKRRAAVQGKNGGCKKGGGKRERTFGVDQGNAANMADHDAEKPKAGGDDATYLLRFMKQHSTIDEEDEMASASQSQQYDANYSPLSFAEISSKENDGTTANFTALLLEEHSDESHSNDDVVAKNLYTPPASELREALSLATEGARGPKKKSTEVFRTPQVHQPESSPPPAANDNYTYHTPDVYAWGQLANPRVIKNFPPDSAPREDGKKPYSALPPAANDEYIFRTPDVYAWGQLANPRVVKKFPESAKMDEQIQTHNESANRPIGNTGLSARDAVNDPVANTLHDPANATKGDFHVAMSPIIPKGKARRVSESPETID